MKKEIQIMYGLIQDITKLLINKMIELKFIQMRILTSIY